MAYEIAKLIFLILFLFGINSPLPQAKKPLLLNAGAITLIDIESNLIVGTCLDTNNIYPS